MQFQMIREGSEVETDEVSTYVAQYNCICKHIRFPVCAHKYRFKTDNQIVALIYLRWK
jgi:hypothetical protein